MIELIKATVRFIKRYRSDKRILGKYVGERFANAFRGNEQ